MTAGQWTVRRSHIAFQTPWFSVRSDDCVTPSGVEIAPYYVLDFPDFVHVLATIDARIVLVRQYRHAYGGWSLELPGGIMDPGETDAVAVGARELREETGYAQGRWSYVMPFSIDPARYGNRVHLVRADDVVVGPASPDPSESIETILVSAAEATRLATSGGIVNATHAAMLLVGLATASGAVSS